MEYGLIGGRLGHSLSPQIHKLFFTYTGVAGTYNLLETEAENLPKLLSEMKKNYRGSNVTIPHKLAVIPLLDQLSDEAKAIGAVNTIWFTEGKLKGYNTDYFGFARMLEYNQIKVTGNTAAVLGSGGAARAVVKYLTDEQAEKIYLVTRNVEQVDKSFQDLAPQLEFIDYAALENISGEIIINCTPVGMYPKTDCSPVKDAVLANFNNAVDLIYNPAQTKFLQAAAKAGKKAVNGLFMLVAQAVAAQEIWQQQKYDSELIVRIMRELEQNL